MAREAALLLSSQGISLSYDYAYGPAKKVYLVVNQSMNAFPFESNVPTFLIALVYTSHLL